MTLQVQSAISLKPFNTFGVDVQARLFAEAHSDDDVREALAYSAEHDVPLLVIGGGSNLLLSADVQSLVVRMASRGIRIVHEDCLESIVEAEAGEPWHPFVQSCLELGLAGLENLSLIPGTVGAAPMTRRRLGRLPARASTSIRSQRPASRLPMAANRISDG